ncbi:MAG TPA: nicotinate-nucleotide--dimethylbenzimidazole phosphoribosyltransferase [Acidimicrobiales bacterium]|nr:nicotinate-nucleotide--dimethylbenzimidazole phosphoribosyltransferase [Acidimicrobiales bacterium]
MTDQLPFDAVVFFPGALVEAASPERALPGVPRLLAALARLGVRVAVIGDQELEGVPPVAHPDEVAPAERTLLVDETAPAAPQVLAALADGMGVFAAATKLVGPLDDAAVQAATGRHLSLTKPPGSLGRLEALGIQLAGISGQAVPPLPRPAAVAVFAADHGVHAQGVSLWPQEVTTQMVANFVAGGAAINVLARQAGVDVVVVDVGVAADLPDALTSSADAATASPAATEAGGGRRLIDRKIARGTADLSAGPAMTPEQARAALDAGAEVAAELVAHGHRCLLTGDMGIANTTASTALIVALADRRATEITGPGAGLPPADVPRKVAVVAAAAARARDRHGDDALAILAEIGGFEHAALAGFIVAGAALGVPVVVDGVIAAAALLVASRLAPGVEASTIGGHRSVEPGSSAVLETLGLTPVLDLDLRLGEGTGAALAYPLIEAAARILGEMATFDQAGVSAKAH